MPLCCNLCSHLGQEWKDILAFIINGNNHVTSIPGTTIASDATERIDCRFEPLHSCNCRKQAIHIVLSEFAVSMTTLLGWHAYELFFMVQKSRFSVAHNASPKLKTACLCREHGGYRYQADQFNEVYCSSGQRQSNRLPPYP